MRFSERRVALMSAASVIVLAASASPMLAQHSHIWRHTHDDRSIAVSMRGEVELTSDERAVARLSPGGRLQIEESMPGRPERLVIVSATESGVLEYAYIVNGRTRAWDDEGRSWLAGLLPEIARESAMGVESRVRRIHGARGASGVLEEIERIRSSSSRRAHLRALLDLGPLSRNEAARAVAIARGISSSSDRSHVLRILIDQIDMADAGVRRVFFDAADGIASSSEKRRLLIHVLERSTLPEAAAHDAMAAAGGISSSSERAAVLVTAGRLHPLSTDRLRSAFFNAVDGISSSSERRRVLVSLLREQGSDPAIVRDVVRSARRITSDSEKTAVLLAVPALHLRDSSTARTYRDTMETIGSRAARERAMTYLISAQQ